MALAREVRALALPAIGQSLLQTLVVVVDRVMLGHHAESSLAAMQIASALEWSLWSVFSAFEVGTIARVGYHVGARRLERARRAARISLAVALAAGLVVALASPAVIAALPRAAPGASPAAVDAAGAYLGWTLAASPVVFVAMTAFAALQASGDTRTPLAIGVVANVAHVAMNRVLILGAWHLPAMGTRGAGISTALTFVLQAALALAALGARGRALSLRGADRGGRAAWVAEWRRLARVAWPAVAERVLYHAGYVGFVAIIWRLGDAAMAANQALLSVEAICYHGADGFGIAAAALVAMKLGAGAPRDAARASVISARYAAALLTSVGLVALALRAVILPVFSADREVVALGAAAVPVLAVAQPFMALGTVLAQSLRGAGETKSVLAVSAVGAFVVRLSCTWGFAITMGMGLVGVWIGSTLDWATRAVLLVVIGARTARARSGLR